MGGGRNLTFIEESKNCPPIPGRATPLLTGTPPDGRTNSKGVMVLKQSRADLAGVMGGEQSTHCTGKKAEISQIYMLVSKEASHVMNVM